MSNTDVNPQAICNLVKKFISEAKLDDSTKANVVSPSDTNSFEPTLHTALTKDPNIATLLIKKSSDQKLSLIIALQSVKDERADAKSYSIVIADSKPAFYPEFVSMSAPPLAASIKSIRSLDWEQVLKYQEEAKEGEDLSVTELKSFLVSDDYKQSCQPLPYCQVPIAELEELLDIEDDSSMSTIDILVNLLNECLSVDDDAVKAYKEIAKDLVPFLSGLIMESNHNLILPVTVRKMNANTASTNGQWLKQLLFNEQEWFKSKNTSSPSTNPSPVQSPFDDDPFETDEDEANFAQALVQNLPGKPYRTPNAPIPHSSNPPPAQGTSNSIKKAEALQKSLDGPPPDFSSSASTFETFLRQQVHKQSKNKWSTMDRVAKKNLMMLTKDSNNKVYDLIGPELLNAMGSNMKDISIQKELTASLQETMTLVNNRSQLFESFCVTTVKNLCEGVVWNKSAIDKLEDINGISPFSVKPVITKGFHLVTTASKQELYIPLDSIHFIEQLDSFLVLLCLCWSHQCKSSLASYFTPQLPEASLFDVATEPVLIQSVKAFITKLSMLRPHLDELLRVHKEAFALELAVYIHIAFTTLVLTIVNPAAYASSASMIMGIEDKLERKHFRFNPHSPLFNQSSSSVKRSSPTHSPKATGVANSGGRSKTVNKSSSNKKQKRDMQKGFFCLDTNSMTSKDFLTIHKQHTVPSIHNKSICLRCTIFGDDSCHESKRTDSTRFHGPMSKVSKPMLKFASDHNIPLTKQSISAPSAETEPPFPVKKPTQPKRQSSLVRLLRAAYNSVCPTPSASKFKFESNSEAASHNSKILEEANFDLASVLETEPSSCCQPHTELRDPSVLFPLFDLSPNTAEKLKEMMTSGISYPIEDAYLERQEDVEAAMQEENNASTRGSEEFVSKALDKEVNRGWQIPIFPEIIPKIIGAGRIKLGVAKRKFIDSLGKLFTKSRVTHDCSQPQQSGKSVNLLCIKDKLQPTRYGKAFYRYLLNLYNARYHNPGIPILQAKFDMDSAYRRCFVNLQYALLCCTVFLSLGYILLRLPFGSSPAAGEFSVLTDFIADIANKLYQDASWDPYTMYSALVDGIPMYEFTRGPLSNVKPLSIFNFLPVFSIYTEVFIDDFLVFVVCSNMDNVYRAFHGIPWILDCIFRPTAPDEPVDRPPILNPDKLRAEGTLREQQVILGWLVCTASMKIFITSSKASLMIHMLDNFIIIAQSGKALNWQLRKDLESLIGKLQDVSLGFHEGNYFLNRLRYRHRASIKPFRQKFDEMELKDLIFWKSVVNKLREGAAGWSLHHILPTARDYFTISDAAEHGLGGYFILENIVFAWRFEIPPEWRGILTLNLLEFVGSYWTLHLLISLIREVSPEDFRVLAISDSNSALGWMKTNCFDPHLQPAHDIVCRAIGKDLAHNSVSLDRLHIAGKHNHIADSLSRDTDIHPVALCDALLHHPTCKHMLAGKKVMLFEQNGEELSSFMLSLVHALQPKKPTPISPAQTGSSHASPSDVLSGFAFVLRHDWFATNRGKPLTTDVIRQHVGTICQEFVRRDLPDPSRNSLGQLRYEFKKFYKACAKADPAPNRKASLNGAVFSHLHSSPSKPIQHAIGQLCNGALHYGMRACEYSTTSDKEPLTQLLELKDLTFLRNGKITASRSSAEAIMITFRFQKNGEKEESLVRKRGAKAKYCPVRGWASIVDRILSYPNTSMSSPVNTVHINGKLGFITSAMITTRLRQVMRSLDKDFPLSKVTPHSIRASYATMLFQEGAPLEAVKLNGRWKSDAFLLYIRKNSLVVDLSPALSDQQNLQCIYVN